MEYRYKELSHIECHKEHRALLEPTRIEKGERYDDMFYVIEDSVAKEDKTSPLFFDFSFCEYYKAKETRFSCDRHIGTVSYIEKNCEYLIWKFDDWYIRAKIIVHFLDGSTITKYFNTDAEMETYANFNFSGLNKRMRS